MGEFVDGNKDGDDYVYDPNGNMTQDLNKGIKGATLAEKGIEYNHLNIPTKVSIDDGGANKGTISYIYDATGVKLRKNVLKQGETTPTSTDYAGNYIYENGKLQFFSTPEGTVSPKDVNDYSQGFDYVYNYVDHLGNIRLSYTDANGDGSIDPANEIVKENNYYPFGLAHKGYNNNVSPHGNSKAKKWEYANKEFEDELGKNTVAYEWRDYDPAIARFNKPDRYAEKYANVSPYAFTANNPLLFKEIKGDSLQVIGSEDALLDLSNLIYRSLGSLYDVDINSDTGFVTLNRNSTNGQLNTEQQGFFDVLNESIGHQDTASFTIMEDGGAFSNDVIVGDNGESSISANPGSHTIDMTDILAFPTMGNGKLTEAGAIAHEIKEGFEIQVNGTDPFVSHTRHALGAERQSTGTVITGTGASLVSPTQLSVPVMTRGANNQAVRSTVIINLQNNDITTITNN